MERQHLLRGFGCIDGEYPEKLTDISPAQLEQITGLSITSLTPKERTTYWRLAGIALVIAEYIFGTNVGIDPIYTLIPGTLLIFGLDQIAFSGKYFETIYRKLFPEYTKKIIYHEAGHFLLSYLLGVPVRGYITSSWDAKKYPEIKGQAGTIFFDNKLAEEINSQKVTRTSIDRLSVVVMAGIAAEALKFGRAEGGVLDEQSLIGFLTSIQPPWNIMRIQGQARWAAVQAILLIREHQEAYDALVTAMEANKPVGDIVLEIEKNLPEVLPSQKRIQERDSTKKRRERDNLLRYIQKMTWNVNGIQPEETQTLTTESDEEQSVSPREMLDQFTERMKMLETAVKSGALDIKTVDESNSKGGIWLNNLDSIKNPSKSESDVKIPSSSMKSNFGNEKLEFPEPLPNYEQRLSELAEEEGKTEHNTVNNNVFARSETVLKNDNSDDSNKASSSANKTLGIREMLMNNRGFQMKQLELVELADKKTVSTSFLLSTRI